MNYVYRYFNKDHELIYVGLSKVHPYVRLEKRKNLEVDWYDEIDKIEFVEFEHFKEMEFCEFYLISKHKPKYNIRDKNYNINYDIKYFDNLEWKSWKKEDFYNEIYLNKSKRRSKINYDLWSNEEYKKERVSKMARKKFLLTFPNGNEVLFKSRSEMDKFLKNSYDMSVRVSNRILKTGEPYKTHYSKFKNLEGMIIKEVKE